MSLRISRSLMGSHLENAQRGEILLRWLSPGVIEQVDGGDDDRRIPTIPTGGKPQPSVNRCRATYFP